MDILSSCPPARRLVSTTKTESAQHPLLPSKPSKDPLPEALVELPHVLLDAFEVSPDSSGWAASAHLGVSGLAAIRAAQCFAGSGWESKLEGASALSLAAAGVISMLPGGLAHTMGEAAHTGHGLLELGLGTHEVLEALRAKDSDWKELAAGALGAVKGLAVLAPVVMPSLEHASHWIQVGAMVGRVGLSLAD